ncbi:MAG: CheR family methyltransferase [Actinomycetota bacterium]
MTAPNAGFSELLEYLNASRSVDFTAYKPASLRRRIDKRMRAVGAESFEGYRELLELHPEEFDALFDTILINVTSFFRDPAAWEYIGSTVIPAIIEPKDPTEPIRIWSAGSASGEEPYTAAILFAEALGVDAFRHRVKIYATDIDEGALTSARAARYSERQLQSVPDDLRSRYFERSGDQYAFAVDTRRAVLFGRHNLLKDAPISRIDLLLCRNTLMYFNTEAQHQVLARFRYALNPKGFLFLGKAETILNDETGFVPYSLGERVFVKKGCADPVGGAAPARRGDDPSPELLALAFDTASLPQVVFDVDGTLVLANAAAREFLDMQGERQHLEDLHITDRPVELRAVVRRAIDERTPFALPGVERRTRSDGVALIVDVLVTPIIGTAAGVLGVAISVRDVTDEQAIRREAERARGELQTAYEELQSTVEELETTNEELQSSNEELETTNEELQSTNEELETMSEEVQATNDELDARAQEMRGHVDLLEIREAFIASILQSVWIGIVVLDDELRVTSWNAMAEELWGVRADETVGQPFLKLDIGLPLDQLVKALRNCLRGRSAREELVVDATDRRGRAISCRVSMVALRDADEHPRGIVLLMSVADAARPTKRART